MLATFMLLACYVPVAVLPDAAADSAFFNQPAPVDAGATVFCLSPAQGTVIGVQQAPNDALMAITTCTGAIPIGSQYALPGTNSAYAMAGDVAYVVTTPERGAATLPLWPPVVPLIAHRCGGRGLPVASLNPASQQMESVYTCRSPRQDRSRRSRSSRCAPPTGYATGTWAPAAGMPQ